MEKEVKNENTTVENTNVEVSQAAAPATNAVANQAVAATATKAATFGMGKIIAIIAAVLVVAGAGVAIVLLSGGKKNSNMSEKSVDKSQVYSNAINTTFDKLGDVLDAADSIKEKFDAGDNAIYFKGNVQFDTNIKDVTDEIPVDINKFKFAFEMGVDPKKEDAVVGATVNDTLNAKVYTTNGKYYLVSDLLDKPVDITRELESELDLDDLKDTLKKYDYQEVMEEVENVDFDQINSILDVLQEALIAGIDSATIKESNDSFTVDGTKVDAKKLSCEINGETLKAMIKAMANKINDDEFISNVAELTGISSSELKQYIDALSDTETLDALASQLDIDMSINVFVKKDSDDVIGFNIIFEDEEILSFYSSDSAMVAKFGVGSDSIVLTVKESKKSTDFELKYNGKKLATGTIRELSEDKIDLEFTLYTDGDEMGMTIYLSQNEQKDSITGEFDVKITNNSEYISFSGDYSLYTKDSVEKINVSNAIKLSDIDEEELLEKIESKIASNKELKELFEALLETDSEYEIED